MPFSVSSFNIVKASVIPLSGPIPTATPTPTATPAPTATPTPTPVPPTATPTPSPTATPTPTPTILSIVTDGLIMNNDMDSASAGSVLDTSGNGYNISLFGGVTSGSLPGRITLNGSTQYGTAAAAAANCYVGGTGLTAEAWINISLGATRTIIANYNGNVVPDTGRTGFGFSITSTGKVYFSYSYGGGQYYIARSSDNTISASTWVHVAATWNRSLLDTGILLYINGVAQSTTASSTTVAAVGASALATQIGRSLVSAGYTNYLNGSIGQTRIYNRALSAGEISQNYNATSAEFV